MNNKTITESKKEPTNETEKSNTCYCHASGFWSSCSINCPVVHGVCLANCTTSGVWGIGWLGSVATCTCGSAGAGKHHIVPEGVYYDDVNVDNLESIEEFVRNKTEFNYFHSELSDLLGVIKGTQTGDLVTESQEFFDKLESLTDDQKLILKPVIAQLMIDNGRN